MARKIMRLPGQASRAMLQLISGIITFIFVLFTYVSGQAPEQGMQALPKSMAGLAAAAGDPVVLYGISPLYGVVLLYGMPYADFSIKGVLRSQSGLNPVKEIKVTLEDTSSKLIVDSAFTAADGSFGFSLSGSPWQNTWILSARDVDGKENGRYFQKDTLITIPADSLKGASGFYAGKGEINVEMYLRENTTEARHVPEADLSAGALLAAIRLPDGTMEARFHLSGAGNVLLALYGANGRLVREIIDEQYAAGDHIAAIETGGLQAGVYFLKLLAGSRAVITKITLSR
jgi:putative lipoprotein (rSAM/lipoprotein system)